MASTIKLLSALMQYLLFASLPLSVFAFLYLEILSWTPQTAWGLVSLTFLLMVFSFVFAVLHKLRKYHLHKVAAVKSSLEQQITRLRKDLGKKHLSIKKQKRLESLLVQHGMTYEDLVKYISTGGKCHHAHAHDLKITAGANGIESCCELVPYLRQQVNQFRSSLSDLQFRYNAKSFQLFHLKKTHKITCEEEIEYSESEYSRMYGDKFLLEEHNKKLGKKIASLESEMASLSQVKKDLGTEVERLQQVVGDSGLSQERDIAELRIQLVEARSKLEEKEKFSDIVSANLRCQLDSKQKEIQQKTVELANAGKEAATLQDQLAAFNAKISQLSETKVAAEQKLAKQEAQGLTDSKEIEQLVQREAELEGKLAEALERCKHTSPSPIQPTQSVGNELQQTVNSLKQDLASQSSTIDNLRKQLGQAQSESLQPATTELEQQIASLKAQLASRDSTIEKLEAQQQQVPTQSALPSVDVLQSKIEALQKKLCNSDETIVDLRSQLSHANAQQASSTSKQAQDEIAKLTVEVGECNGTISNLQSQLDQARSQQNQGSKLTNEQIDAAQASYNQLQATHITLQGQYNQLETSYRALQDRYNAVSASSSRLEDVEGNLHAEKFKLEQAQHELKTLTTQRNELLNRPTQDDLARMKHTAEHWELQFQAKQQENIANSGQVLHLGGEIARYKETVHRLEDRLRQAQGTPVDLQQNQVAVNKDELVKLNSERTAFSTQLDTLRTAMEKGFMEVFGRPLAGPDTLEGFVRMMTYLGVTARQIYKEDGGDLSKFQPVAVLKNVAATAKRYGFVLDTMAKKLRDQGEMIKVTRDSKMQEDIIASLDKTLTLRTSAKHMLKEMFEKLQVKGDVDQILSNGEALKNILDTFVMTLTSGADAMKEVQSLRQQLKDVWEPVMKSLHSCALHPEGLAKLPERINQILSILINVATPINQRLEKGKQINLLELDKYAMDVFNELGSLEGLAQQMTVLLKDLDSEFRHFERPSHNVDLILHQLQPILAARKKLLADLHARGLGTFADEIPALIQFVQDAPRVAEDVARVANAETRAAPAISKRKPDQELKPDQKRLRPTTEDGDGDFGDNGDEEDSEAETEDMYGPERSS